jgi:plasmid stabilization system protein ParE
MSGWQIRYTRFAQNDLDRIEDSAVANNGRRAATKFVNRLIAACDSLKSAPHRKTIRDDL